MHAKDSPEKLPRGNEFENCNPQVSGSSPGGRPPNNFYPGCVVPDMFALNGSTQQASGGVLINTEW